MTLTVQNNAQGKQRSEKTCVKIMRTDHPIKLPIVIFMSSANAFNLDQSKNLSFGKGLNYAVNFTKQSSDY